MANKMKCYLNVGGERTNAFLPVKVMQQKRFWSGYSAGCEQFGPISKVL